MGRASQSSTEEEGVAFQEAAQADGGQGFAGRHVAMSVSGMWWGQEDARPVHVLLGQ